MREKKRKESQFSQMVGIHGLNNECWMTEIMKEILRLFPCEYQMEEVNSSEQYRLKKYAKSSCSQKDNNLSKEFL